MLQCYNRFLRWFARLQPTAAFVVCGNGLRGQGRMVVGDRKVHDNYLPFMVRSEFVKGKNPMEMARRFVLVLNGGGLVYKSVTYSIIERKYSLCTCVRLCLAIHLLNSSSTNLRPSHSWVLCTIAT